MSWKWGNSMIHSNFLQYVQFSQQLKLNTVNPYVSYSITYLQFNDALNNSAYAVLNGRMISEWPTGKHVKCTCHLPEGTDVDMKIPTAESVTFRMWNTENYINIFPQTSTSTHGVITQYRNKNFIVLRIWNPYIPWKTEHC